MRWLPVLLAAPAAAGAALAVVCPVPPWLPAGGLAAGAVAGAWALHRARERLVLAAALIGVLLAAWAVGSQAEMDARDPPLARRLALAANDGPIVVQGRLLQDAATVPAGIALRLDVGGSLAALTVSGSLALDALPAWRAGRTLRMPATLRRPGHFLDPGVPDHRLAQARRGLVLVGSVKSGALVEVLAPGSRLDETGAALRAHARRALDAHVGSRSPQAAAIARGILIGDRTGLDDEVVERLQAAGTYHVMAISGGNIAILAAVLLGALWLCRVPSRLASLIVLLLLAAYAGIVGAEPSVVRATLMASAYLGLRVLDHRVAPLNALAAAALAMLVARPLSIVDPGFVLTVGATAALILLTPRLLPPFGLAGLRWIAGLVAASLATEVALLPVSALLFNRITAAGLVANLAAVPLMTVVQVAGLATVVLDPVVPMAARAGGWVAAVAADGLVASAGLVETAPWLARRVPAPAWWVVLLYALGAAALFVLPRASRVRGRWRVLGRRLAFCLAAASAAWIVAHPDTWRWPWRVDGRLRVTFLDVGQGDATLIRLPNGDRLLVDAGGGAPGSRFDVGARVVTPALWALGVGGLEALAITHGDPDHLGGAAAVLRDLEPHTVREGVPVPRHEPLAALKARAVGAGAVWASVYAGAEWRYGAAAIRVWHPPPPDWERPRVRNDDSLVLEIQMGAVSIVLPGDIGREVEAGLAGQIPPASLRVLKAPHHGSATSSSASFLDALAPRLVIVSCGRDNRYGHPAPAVLARYAARGTEVLRTDRDGAIALTTDGETLEVHTFTGRRLTLRVRAHNHEGHEGHEGTKGAGRDAWRSGQPAR